MFFFLPRLQGFMNPILVYVFGWREMPLGRITIFIGGAPTHQPTTNPLPQKKINTHLTDTPPSPHHGLVQKTFSQGCCRQSRRSWKSWRISCPRPRCRGGGCGKISSDRSVCRFLLLGVLGWWKWREGKVKWAGDVVSWDKFVQIVRREWKMFVARICTIWSIEI